MYILSQTSTCGFVFIAEARMRSKAMKREALQAAKEAKKERGEWHLADVKMFF